MKLLCRIAIIAVVSATPFGFAQQIRVAGAALEETQNSQPIVSDVVVSHAAVTDVRLRPLFTTTIRLPGPVTSVAVGAPTLFEAEHSDQESRLVYVKPSTKEPAESNLVITMKSGETISMRLISDGVSSATGPVDFIVDYKPQESFFVGSSDPLPVENPEPLKATESKSPLDKELDHQAAIATPAWEHGSVLDEEKSKKGDPPSLVGALGTVRENNGQMLVAYSVRNQSSHWIEVLPPQIEVRRPAGKSEGKKDEKKHIVEAEEVPVATFRVNGRKLAPGERADGVVTFERPNFKQSQEKLLLQLASANSIDKPLLLSVPFVAPSH